MKRAHRRGGALAERLPVRLENGQAGAGACIDHARSARDGEALRLAPAQAGELLQGNTLGRLAQQRLDALSGEQPLDRRQIREPLWALRRAYLLGVVSPVQLHCNDAGGDIQRVRRVADLRRVSRADRLSLEVRPMADLAPVLTDYFAGRRKAFDLKLDFAGTDLMTAANGVKGIAPPV